MGVGSGGAGDKLETVVITLAGVSSLAAALLSFL